MSSSRQTAKALASARVFLKYDKTFESIIQMCSLTPKNNDWRIWEDEAGNFLRLHKNGSCHIYPSNNLKIHTKDIYRKSRAWQIANISYWALLAFEAGHTDCANIWFLGNDNKLRVCYFQNGKHMSNSLPLTSKIQTLRLIAERKHIKSLKPVDNMNYTFTYTSQWPLQNLDKFLQTNPKAESILVECSHGR